MPVVINVTSRSYSAPQDAITTRYILTNEGICRRLESNKKGSNSEISKAVFNYHQCTPESISHINHSQSGNILSVMKQLRHDRKLCDVIFEAGGSEFYAHRLVLAASSPYFNAMFTNDLLETHTEIIKLHNVSSPVMELILEYFYTSIINITCDNVFDLLTTACMLQVISLQQACCDFAKEHLNLKNCLEIRQFADLFSLSDLKEAADSFARNHFQELIEIQEFHDLDIKVLLEFLSAKTLSSAPPLEGVLCYDSIMSWLRHKPKERSKYITTLLTQTCVHFMSYKFLKETVIGDPLIQSNIAAVSMVTEALQCQETSKETLKQETIPKNSKGKVMVVFGGMGKSIPTSTVQRYDPISNSWSHGSPLRSRRWGIGVAPLSNYIYIVGGVNEKSESLCSVERYNIMEDHWTNETPMSSRRSGLGVTVAEGILYAIGGSDGTLPLRSMEMFNPLCSTCWTPLPSMKTPRYGPGVVYCINQVYVIGGSNGTALNTVECFDPHSHTWTRAPSMSIKRRFPAVAVLSGCIYVMGGCDGTSKLSSVERYDPFTFEWIVIQPMAIPRSGASATSIGRHIFVIGGHDESKPLSSVECYDPLINKWSEITGMGIARDCAGVACYNITN